MTQFTTILKHEGKVAAYSVVLHHDRTCSANLVNCLANEKEGFPHQVSFNNYDENVDQLGIVEKRLFHIIKRTGGEYGY